jgi:holliday junction DNA helicase RuvA
MITYIKGIVQSIGDKVSLKSDCLQMGFAVHVVDVAAFVVDEEVELYIHMHWNQEQGPSLYGFRSLEEKELFVLIIGCSGIGPKMALTILSQTDANTFVGAIQTGDIKTLSQLKGVGSKKAEQMVLQLKNKVASFVSSHALSFVGMTQHLGQLSEVLQSLNYSRLEIQRVLSYMRAQEWESKPSFDQVMRQALSFLAKKV